MDHFIFRGFNGRLVAKSPGKKSLIFITFEYDQYMRYLSLWFGCILDISPGEFKNQYGSQSCGIDGASANFNFDIPVELWGQHGDWA